MICYHHFYCIESLDFNRFEVDDNDEPFLWNKNARCRCTIYILFHWFDVDNLPISRQRMAIARAVWPFLSTETLYKVNAQLKILIHHWIWAIGRLSNSKKTTSEYQWRNWSHRSLVPDFTINKTFWMKAIQYEFIYTVFHPNAMCCNQQKISHLPNDAVCPIGKGLVFLSFFLLPFLKFPMKYRSIQSIEIIVKWNDSIQYLFVGAACSSSLRSSSNEQQCSATIDWNWFGFYHRIEWAIKFYSNCEWSFGRKIWKGTRLQLNVPQVHSASIDCP